MGDLITMFPLHQQGIFRSKRKPFELRRNNRKDSTIAMGNRRLQVAGHLLWCESALYLQRLKLPSLSCAYRIWETASKNKHSVLQLLEPHATALGCELCLERPWSPIVTMRQDCNRSRWRSSAEIRRNRGMLELAIRRTFAAGNRCCHQPCGNCSKDGSSLWGRRQLSRAT